MSSAWFTLIVAGLLEICWATGLKYTQGFTRIGPSLFTLVTLSASMYLLAKATQSLPIGIAYAAWVGIGAVGVALLGAVVLKEPMSLAQTFFLCLLVVSIVGLKFST